jgi:glutamate-1-semialdehyde 2,1-aminomutase
MVNSGTEATMSAIRLARGYTNRDKIIKFDGCYHGHVDSLLIKAGSGVSTFGLPDSPGIPSELARKTLSCEFNNKEEFLKVFNKNKKDIAAVIIEPIAGNMGFIEPDINFLKELRNLCTQNKTILIFDEVMTGFRVARGGVQELLGITPDLTALGKIVGAGLPVGVYGGKAEIMNNISPDGPVYQAGTLSGNPIAVSAGTALLKQLGNKEIYASMEQNAKSFLNPIKEYADELKMPFSFNVRGGMFGFFFSNSLPKNFDDVQKTDIELFAKFFRKMLEKNIYLPPSAYESCFISTLHDEEKMTKAAKLAKQSLKEIKDEI